MEGYRIVDLSLPIMHGGGFAMPAPTIDQVPLDWCCGEGVWIDPSWKKPGKDIHAGDIERALQDITC
jgi:kynurenine formamidase